MSDILFRKRPFRRCRTPQLYIFLSQTKWDKVVCPKHVRQPVYPDKLVSDIASESDWDDLGQRYLVCLVSQAFLVLWGFVNTSGEEHICFCWIGSLLPDFPHSCVQHNVVNDSLIWWFAISKEAWSCTVKHSSFRLSQYDSRWLCVQCPFGLPTLFLSKVLRLYCCRN